MNLEDYLNAYEDDLSDEALSTCADILTKAIEARETLDSLGVNDESADDLRWMLERINSAIERRERLREIENWRRVQGLVREAIR